MIKAFIILMSLSIVGFPLTDSLNGLCSVSNANTVLVGVWVVSGPLVCRNPKSAAGLNGQNAHCPLLLMQVHFRLSRGRIILPIHLAHLKDEMMSDSVLLSNLSISYCEFREKITQVCKLKRHRLD